MKVVTALPETFGCVDAVDVLSVCDVPSIIHVYLTLALVRLSL